MIFFLLKYIYTSVTESADPPENGAKTLVRASEYINWRKEKEEKYVENNREC